MAMPYIDELKHWGDGSLSGHQGNLMHLGVEPGSMQSDEVVLSSRMEGELSMEEIFRLWENFACELGKEKFSSDVAVFPVWLRTRHANSLGSHIPVRLRRAPDMEVRVQENQFLLQSARPLLKRFSSSLGTSKHVVCLSDAAGVLLESVGNDTILKIYGLLPGYDWSEDVMGTNGVGTALAIGKPVAVLGPDHYQLPFRDSACLGALIKRDSDVLGAVDLRIHVREVRPELLRSVITLAAEIGSTVARYPM